MEKYVVKDVSISPGKQNIPQSFSILKLVVADDLDSGRVPACVRITPLLLGLPRY